jgi:TRAP-type C4-dicarboxylate transport system substrate-binding protein
MIVTGFFDVVTTQAASKPITLKAVISMPYRPGGRGQEYVDFINRVNKRAKGELVIDFRGGAEVIPPFNQFESILDGVVDMGWLFSGAYQRQIPEIISYPCSELTRTEERTVGYHDLMIELHKKKGMYYVGRLGGDGFVWQSNKLIKDPRTDFKGLKVAVIGTMWNSFAMKLGIKPVMIMPAEIYTALERGVVEGAGAAAWGAASLRWGEVCKYQIDHPFWQTGGSTSLMSLKSWNRLPKHLQDLIKDEQLNTEKILKKFFDEKLQGERKRLRDQGLTFIKFSPEDAQWYLDMSKEAKWEEVKKAAPGSYDKLRSMLIKK